MSHSITMSKSSLTTKRSPSNSSIATYMTFPVILKAIQVIVGIVCLWIAGNDLLENFEDLATRTAAVITKDRFTDLVEALQKTLRIPREYDFVFIDQMLCRMIFLTTVTIFLIISLIQLTWFPVSLFAGPIKSRIISGVVYHLIGCGLKLVVSLKLLDRINLLQDDFVNSKLMRIAAMIGLVNAALYLLGAIPALWSFRGKKFFRSRSSSKSHRIDLKQSLPKFEACPN